MWTCVLLSLVAVASAATVKDSKPHFETDFNIDDTKLTGRQYQLLHGLGPKKLNGGAPKAEAITLWPGGVLPYQPIDSRIFGSSGVNLINEAIKEIEEYTCIKIRPRITSDRHWVKFTGQTDGCWSWLGLLSQGEQELNLAPYGCVYKGIIIHEILHALGLIHEHQHWDRDDYVNIRWENIKTDNMHNFNIMQKDQYRRHGVTYSYHSIMHYSSTAFSKNGLDTIVPKDSSFARYLGNRGGLGYNDVEYLNLLYSCAKSCPNPTKCGPTGHLNKDCNCVCEDGSDDCDSTKTDKTDASCTNTYIPSWDCHKFAKESRCSTSSVRGKCDKACGVCGGSGTGTGGNCKDSSTSCASYRSHGFCQTMEDTMRNICAKTCGMCSSDKPSGTCVNKADDVDCKSYADKNHCTLYPAWMNANCAKACGTCSGTSA